jgi:hypothetical protein
MDPDVKENKDLPNNELSNDEILSFIRENELTETEITRNRKS